MCSLFFLSASKGLIPPNISPKFKEENSFKVMFTPRHTLDPDQIKEDENGQVDPYSDIPGDPSFDWTVVYDEGIDWTYNKKRLIGYFKYLHVKPEDREESESNKHSVPTVRSFCGTTMIGWWRDLDGKKVNHSDTAYCT